MWHEQKIVVLNLKYDTKMDTKSKLHTTDLVFKVEDAVVQRLQQLVEFGQWEFWPPMLQHATIHILQHPEKTHQQVSGRLLTQHALAVL